MIGLRPVFSADGKTARMTANEKGEAVVRWVRVHARQGVDVTRTWFPRDAVNPDESTHWSVLVVEQGIDFVRWFDLAQAYLRGDAVSLESLVDLGWALSLGEDWADLDADVRAIVDAAFYETADLAAGHPEVWHEVEP